MAVKKSRKHCGFVIYSYFKDCACDLLERNKDFNYSNTVENLAFFDPFMFKSFGQGID